MTFSVSTSKFFKFDVLNYIFRPKKCSLKEQWVHPDENSMWNGETNECANEEYRQLLVIFIHLGTCQLLNIRRGGLLSCLTAVDFYLIT